MVQGRVANGTGRREKDTPNEEGEGCRRGTQVKVDAEKERPGSEKIQKEQKQEDLAAGWKHPKQRRRVDPRRG